jgi:nucleoside-diphosphate-sugar epimerase
MSTGFVVQTNDLILVTGASGFIGTRVVDNLLGRGFRNLRCFVRPSSRLGVLEQTIGRHAASNAVEIVAGDLVSRDDCSRAAAGAFVVYHLAAGFDKSFAAAFMNSALATRNLIEAFCAHGQVVRFVNVSSFAVYSNLSLKRGAPLDETAPLEESPQERYDAYCFGKLKQEEIVRRYGREHGLPYVILRPGTVFGPGKSELTGRIGVGTFGIFLHIGGSNLLPLTYVDNCADAIVLGGLIPGVEGEIFNVVDDSPLTSSEFLRAYRRKGKPFRSIRVPYTLAYAFCRMWEAYSIGSKGQLPPAFNRRRCAAEWRGNIFPNAKARRLLGWVPKLPMSQAMSLFLAQFDPRAGQS